ncbi:MAG: hypothetical protein COA45_06160 [Zetaproteobacteria bacterium]|nr:MAG: hypothetical protein COA45_06160 [Zetaproteobacteria bacterium]
MNDDLDEDIIGSEDDFDEFSQQSDMGGSIRQSPVAKIAIIGVAILAIVGVMFMFGGSSIKEEVSRMPAGSDITSVPGTDEALSPAYIEAVEEQNEAELERAISENLSAIPVPVQTQDTRLEAPEIEEASEDPLHRWRLLQDERIEREMKIRETEIEPVTVLNAEQQGEALDALAGSMEEQMSSLLAANTDEKTMTTVTLISYSDESDVNGSGNGSGSGNDGDGGGFSEDDEEVVVIPAGKIVYGQMLLQANSDVDAVVLAQMVSGPLKGWKLLGEFELEEDLGKLLITFDIAVNADGDQYDIDALMLDPDNGLAAMRTDIDHRYFKRIVFPAAAAFIEGFASAVADSGATSVTVSGSSGTVTEEEEESTDEQEVALGVEEAASEISEILGDMADIPIQVVIAAGTPIGIFFVENVVEEEGDI